MLLLGVFMCETSWKHGTNGCLRNKVLPSGTRHCLSVALCMERKGRDNQGGDIATEHIRGVGRGGGDSFRVSGPYPEFSFQLCLSAGSSPP